MNSIEREKQWTKVHERLRDITANADEITEALRAHHAAYYEGLEYWLARLYDSKIGGFYYSNSGRDTDGYLPDIESTYQATTILTSSGMFSSWDELPDGLKEGIARFTCSLQSPEDGYIYHPQWGKKIIDSRRGRDMKWAVGLSERLGFKLPYPTAMDRLKAHSSNTGGVQNVAEHLKSPEAFLEYLRALDWKERAYPSGNQIAAQVDEIRAAGLADVACDFLDSVQNKETGLWHPTAGYKAVNGAFKISFLYLSANRKMPNADRVLAAAVDAMTTDKEVAGTACYVYNTWYTVNNILRLRGEVGKTPEVLLRGAPEAIRQTTEKLKAFMVGDGSCSMCPGHTVAESQRARVAVSNNIKEGDVNATVIAAPSTTNSMYSALGLTDVAVPMLGDEEREIFIKSLGTACK